MALNLACTNIYSSGIRVLMANIDLLDQKQYMDPAVTFEKMLSLLSPNKRDASVFSLLQSALFLRGIQNGDVKVVKKILDSSRKELSSCVEKLCVQCVQKQFRIHVVAFDKERPQGSCITFADWLEGVYAADLYFEILDQLLKFEKIVCGRIMYGWTVLHLAIFKCLPQFGDSEVKTAEILLKSGRFDVNALTDEQETVLHFACSSKSLSEWNKDRPKYYCNLKELVQRILKHKVDINQRNMTGQTALMIACMNGNVDSVREIIKWDLRNGLTLDVEIKDINDQTALSLVPCQDAEENIVAMIKPKIFLTAVKKGDMDIVKIYVNIIRSYENKRQIFKTAIERFKSRAAFTFESRPFVSHSVLLEAVLIAYNESNDKILELLFSDFRFTGVDERNPNFTSTMLPIFAKLEQHYRYVESNPNFRRIVLNNLAKVGKNDRYSFYGTRHENVFHLALEDYVGTDEEDYPMLQKIKSLLKLDDSNYRKGKMLETICRSLPALSLSRQTFRSRIKTLIRLLIEYGVDLNGRHYGGKTPLIIACEYGDVDTVRSLLKFARKNEIILEIEAIDNSGETALMKAKREGDKRILGVLKESDFVAAVKNEEKDLVKSLLDSAEIGIAKFTKSLLTMADSRYPDCRMLIECGIDFDTWTEAVQIAVRNSSKDILELLLNYNIIVQNRELVIPFKDGDTILHRIFNERDYCDTDQLHVIEVLLESGKINANALNFQAETVLHSMLESCHGKFGSRCQENHNDVIYDAIKLFLCFDANVNQRDIDGRTPLIMTSKYGCAGAMQTILNWSEETNTRLELDAQDFRGRTALIEAVIRGESSMVEMLLNFGASINLCDHRGFTALHHALCKAFISRKWSILNDDQREYRSWIDFDDFPRDFVELRKMKEMNATLIQNIRRNQNNENIEDELDKDIISVAKLLLARQDVDVNIIQSNGFSPLDIVEASIADIPFSIKEFLKKKGAVLNVYQSQSNQIKSKFDFDVGCVNFVLHRLATADIFPILWMTNRADDRYPKILSERSKSLEKLGEGFFKLSAKVRKEMVSSKDGKGRTPLHAAVIACTRDIWIDDKIKIVKHLLSLGCDVNETDAYGRTPVQYVRDDKLQNLLLSYRPRAGVEIKPKNKISDNSLKSPHSSSVNEDIVKKEFYKAVDRIDKMFTARDTIEMHSKFEADASNKGKTGIRAIKMSENGSVEHNLTSSECVSEGIEIDEILLAGDGNRAVADDDNDCHITETPIQCIDARVNKLMPWCKHLNPKTVADFVWKNGAYAYRHPAASPVTEEVKQIIDDIATEIERRDPRFEVKPMLMGSAYEGTRIGLPDEFDFNLHLTKFSQLCEVSTSPELPTGYVHLKRKRTKNEEIKASEFDSFFTKDGILITEKVKEQFLVILTNIVKYAKNQQNCCWNWTFDEYDMHGDKPATTLIMKDMKFEHSNAELAPRISIDIVPCFHIDGWWPDEAISNVSEDIKSSGCILVFDRPQRKHCWVPYSKSCVRISFSPAESEAIKRSCGIAKQAFMMGKKYCKYGDCYTTYVLKSSMLYCIEAFSDTSEKIGNISVYVWLECLMKYHLEFLLQNFCPTYFMPNFHLPIENHHRWTIENSEFLRFYKKYYGLYRIISMDASKCRLRMPSLNPFCEHFDRKQVIKDLGEVASTRFGESIPDLVGCGRDQCDHHCKDALGNLRSSALDSEAIDNDMRNSSSDQHEILFKR